MVGLPYPNIYSPELKEKMTYLDATLGVRIYTCRFKLSGGAVGREDGGGDSLQGKWRSLQKNASAILH